MRGLKAALSILLLAVWGTTSPAAPGPSASGEPGNETAPDTPPASERAEAREPDDQRRLPLEMVPIPAGSFVVGTSRENSDDRSPREVKIDSFLLDRTEVTVARFAACVEEGACGPELFAGYEDDSRCNYGAPQRERHPLNCISHDGAAAYCKWAEKRLPTEAEWEKAARSGGESVYPWGAEPPSCERVVMSDHSGTGCGADATWEVASRPRGVSEHGVFDLLGNVREWVADWYDEAYYRDAPATNPPGPGDGSERVVRGADWLTSPDGFERGATRRGHAAPHHRDPGIGFRCAADMP